MLLTSAINSRSTDNSPLVRSIGAKGRRPESDNPIVAVNRNLAEVHLQLPWLRLVHAICVPVARQDGTAPHVTARDEEDSTSVSQKRRKCALPYTVALHGGLVTLRVIGENIVNAPRNPLRNKRLCVPLLPSMYVLLLYDKLYGRGDISPLRPSSLSPKRG